MWIYEDVARTWGLIYKERMSRLQHYCLQHRRGDIIKVNKIMGTIGRVVA